LYKKGKKDKGQAVGGRAESRDMEKSVRRKKKKGEGQRLGKGSTTCEMGAAGKNRGGTKAIGEKRRFTAQLLSATN